MDAKKRMTKTTKKILIIDDDNGVRDAVRLVLEEIDLIKIEVLESADVSSGVKKLKDNHPDIVILDLHMPGKSGFDFMDIVQKDKTLSNTKIIMLTADDTLENVFSAEGKGIGVYHFLGKPFNVAELQALVLSLIFPTKPTQNR